ncbi:hypothetical protein AJ87_08545 [Rhizobium yanglingense]|nr:hypothetical protein AJ87_08545 [Rhizobium yanglingense]
MSNVSDVIEETHKGPSALLGAVAGFSLIQEDGFKSAFVGADRATKDPRHLCRESRQPYELVA